MGNTALKKPGDTKDNTETTSTQGVRINAGSLVKHKINTQKSSRDLLLIMNRRPKSNLPQPKVLSPGMVVSFAKVESSGFEGEAIIFQTLKDGLVPEDWTGPEDGKIIKGGLICKSYCDKTMQCTCVYDMLDQYFKDNLLNDWGWRPILNGEGDTRALLIIRDNSH